MEEVRRSWVVFFDGILSFFFVENGFGGAKATAAVTLVGSRDLSNLVVS